MFYSLFYAFPKSRFTLNAEMKRVLLNIFSELFTGMQIKSASTEHWDLNLGGGNIFSGKDAKARSKQEDVSIADLSKAAIKQTKSKRERVHMKYSPLVERYLISHKYETMNNVREWQMLLTQRTEIQKEVDQKFEKFKRIAQQSLDTKKRLSREYNKNCNEIKQKMLENEKAAAKHIETLKQSKKEKLENGGYSEYANMLVSIFNSEHVNNGENNN